MQLKRQETACPEKQDEISYDGKSFVTMRNSTNGEAGEKTRFCYHQSDRHIWAEYSGGGIVKGFLAGFVQRDGSLEFSYVHTNDMGNIRAGECKSYPEILSDGRLTLHESWQWLNGDKSFGKSQLTEVSNA
ncbi:n-acetylglutamate synthase [Oscillospiraceae bacterium CM]|nr:n-acetylglutamate synthase [Oscillospiraceae bacterium CM]